MKQIFFRTLEDAQRFRGWIRDELDIAVDIFTVPDEEEEE